MLAHISVLPASAVLFLTMLELGAGPIAATVIGLLSLAAFSGRILGLPESYGLSGLALAVMFWLATRTARTRRVVTWQWLVAGFVATSISITNLAPAAVLAWSALVAAGVPWRAATRRSLAGASAVLAAVAVMHAGTALIVRSTSQLHALTLTNPAAAGPAEGQALRTLIVLPILVLGAYGARWMADWQRAIMFAALAVVAFSWTLHAWHGTEFFLYSRHWLAAELIICGGVFWYPARWRIASGVTSH